MDSLMVDRSKGGLGDLPEKLKDCGLKRAFHDELGVRKVVFTFCDDMLTTVYRLNTTWSLFSQELEEIFRVAGVNPKHVIRCLLAELGAGISIPVHHDTGFWATKSHRVHMPLVTSEKVEFYTGKTNKELLRVPFPQFEIVELNNRAKHMVKNNWDKSRVHLIFDFVEDHQFELLRFRDLSESDVILQTRRTITVVDENTLAKNIWDDERKDEEPVCAFEEEDTERRRRTQGLLIAIRKIHASDSAQAERFVKEFCKLSMRYSDGEMQADEYVSFLDRVFLNRNYGKDIVGLLHDRERAKTLLACLSDHPTQKPANPSPSQFNFKTFVIAGVMKCGTTSVYEYLNEHPLCVRAKQKEPHAFDWIWNQMCSLPGATLSEKYMRAFQRDLLKGNYFTGEATPSYLLGGTELFKRLKAACPYAKIIVILRNPVQRAWSHYRMTADVTNASTEQLLRRGSVQGKSFSQVIEADLQLLRDSKIDADLTIPSEFEAAYLSGLPSGHGSHSYVGRGLYALQIELMLQVFARNQIIFLKLEDLARDVNVQMRRVFKFLEVEPITIADPKKHNERGTVNSEKSTEDKSTLTKLGEYYEAHNNRLQKLLPDMDFSDWNL